MVTMPGMIPTIQTKVHRKATNGMAFQMKIANKMNQIHGPAVIQINDTINIVKDPAIIVPQTTNQRKFNFSFVLQKQTLSKILSKFPINC